MSLKPAGRNHKGLCPFHDEKTPSFVVTPDRQSYKCFGCGEGGNAFGFLMRMENLTFPEVVRTLAAQHGIEVPETGATGGGGSDALRDANAVAQECYRAELRRPGNPGAAYLAGRGIDAATIERFGIGFAPDVGGAYLLSRAPGELGTHLAMTGAMGSGADAIALGFADHYVHSDWLPALATALETTPAAEAIAAVAMPAPESALLAQREWIDRCYAGDDAATIVGRLLDSTVPAAREAASVILAKSPTGVSVALEAVRAFLASASGG